LASRPDSRHCATRLLPGITRGALQIAQHRALVQALQASVPEPPQPIGNMPVTLGVRHGGPEFDFQSSPPKTIPELIQRAQFCFVHVGKRL